MGRTSCLPAVSEEVDYEAELVIVIGKGDAIFGVDEAMNYVAGYTIGHDVSARDWQLKKDGKQWMVGKTFDTFAPVGPVLVTCDEIRDPCDLGIRLRLNGQTMQDSSTKQLIFSPAAIIAYLSQVMTLMPGDLIFTGTPPGVGMARKPPVYLKPGDVVEVEIDGHTIHPLGKRVPRFSLHIGSEWHRQNERQPVPDRWPRSGRALARGDVATQQGRPEETWTCRADVLLLFDRSGATRAWQGCRTFAQMRGCS